MAAVATLRTTDLAATAPEGFDDKALEDAVTTLAAQLHAGQARWLELLSELDARRLWFVWGVKGCAHWLSWRGGIGLGTAREHVRVARALRALPKITAAFETGELSYSKVRAITRIADSDNEDFLLRIGKTGTASHIEKLVRYARKYLPDDAVDMANRAHAGRTLTYYTDDDGCLVISGRLPSESGELVKKALDAAMDAASEAEWKERREPPEDVPAGTSEATHGPESVPAGTPVPTEGPKNVPAGTSRGRVPIAMRRADALVDLAETFLAGGYRERNAGERYQVQLVVDADAMSQADAGSPEAVRPGPERPNDVPARIEDGPAIAVETARRLACDASVVTLAVAGDGGVLDVGRRTRSIPPAIRRGLQRRDAGCRFPGCTCQRFVDAHHVVHWADGGETRMDNLILVCRHHHRLLHEGGFTVAVTDDGGFAFHRPDGVLIPQSPRPRKAPGGTRSLMGSNARRGVRPGASTARATWQGEPMDYHIALGNLADCARPQRWREGKPDRARAPG